MVIRTGNLTITVADVEATVASIRDIASGTESFVANSQTQYVSDRMTATLTLQIPARSYDSVVQQIRKLAQKVDVENTSSQDVTEEFVDLQSQLNNLKATEQTMIRLLDRATSMNDILAIQRELTNVRGQIERAQGRVNYLQRRSDYSTLAIRVQPVGSATDPFASSSWQPLRTISRAWQASLQTIAAVADVALTLVVFLWWLIPVVALVVWLWRRRRRAPRPVPATAGGPTPPAAAS
jgi:hypothetical protein